MKEAEECRWLNKKHGDGFWICDILLKSVTKEECEKCKNKNIGGKKDEFCKESIKK